MKLRKPANIHEQTALVHWQHSYPRRAMIVLRDAGYSDEQRIDWVRNVAGCREDVIHFAMMDRLPEV